MAADLTESEGGPVAGHGAVSRRSPVAPPTREDRRKAALKANMARRKEQARLRAAQQRDGDIPDDNDERGA